MDIKSAILWFKFLTGKLTIKDGSLCEFSKRYWDLHGSRIKQPIDQLPEYYGTYECPYCKKQFTI